MGGQKFMHQIVDPPPGPIFYHVKELLGYESPETLKHYTRLTIDDLKKTHVKSHPSERQEV
jgi:hypothetical protein